MKYGVEKIWDAQKGSKEHMAKNDFWKKVRSPSIGLSSDLNQLVENRPNVVAPSETLGLVFAYGNSRF